LCGTSHIGVVRRQRVKEMQIQSTYWLEKVLKIISLYVNALCVRCSILSYTRRNSAVSILRIDTAELRRLAGFSCATLYFNNFILES